MKLIIYIDDKVYGLLKYFEDGLGLDDKKDNTDDVKTALMRAVLNGTPLKPLGEEMRITQKSIADEKVLIGFNMAIALCNKHIGGQNEQSFRV